MPSRNIYKDYAEDSYYHIYNRGINKQVIFEDYADYTYFIKLIERYLGNKPFKKENGTKFPTYFGEIELLAYCLMPNHFHLLIYQKDSKDAITRLMRSLTTAYSMYFNKKHKRIGPLFQQRYKAVRIDDQAYLEHISRYIHLNPSDFAEYNWSSYRYYLGMNNIDGDWLLPKQILDLFKTSEDYKKFVEDYKENHDELEQLKHMLADY